MEAWKGLVGAESPYHQLPLAPKVTATVSQEKLKDMAWIHQHGAMHGFINLGYLKAVGFLVDRVP
jgi:hypothetical protein